MRGLGVAARRLPPSPSFCEVRVGHIVALLPGTQLKVNFGVRNGSLGKGEGGRVLYCIVSNRINFLSHCDGRSKNRTIPQTKTHPLWGDSVGFLLGGGLFIGRGKGEGGRGSSLLYSKLARWVV